MSKHEHFTREALEAQDGKKVPLTLEIGGPVIGEATMHFDSEGMQLTAAFRVDDPELEKMLKGPQPFLSDSVIFKQEGE